MSADLILEELFSPERLQQHARSLAEAQPVSARKQGGRQFSVRLRDNASVLLDSYRAIARAVEQGETITPAAEWILDNYHLVEEQVFDIRGDLPPGYYRELPKLTAGPFAGLPRVFGVAWAYVAHTDSRFDPDVLCSFVEAYQEVQPLTIGELWAIPITLRFVLVENLRRAAQRVVRSMKVRADAGAYADRILGLGDDPPEPIATVLADSPRPFTRTLVVELAHRLRDPTPAVAPALQWLEQQMVADGTLIETAVQAEHSRQAGMNVTARNIITSMRGISAVDWPDLFERISPVDALLRAETDFAEMDFPTRDNYRKRIERLARRSKADELAVTRTVIDLAAEAAGRGEEPRRRDPGYYLMGAGQGTIEKAVGFRPRLRDLGRRLSRHLGVGGYIATCIGLAVAVQAAIVAALWAQMDVFWLAVFALLAILPAIDLAATFLSQAILAVARPRALPALELKHGVPPDLGTMVVVPTLLSSASSIEEVIQQLEIHYLANAADDVTFALLSDWTDASAETAPSDEPLLRRAMDGIDRLNRVHPRDGDGRFLLLHRRRVWSETQACWLGWERKRGKLQELNRLLRGATDTTFIAIDGVPPRVPDNVRFVVTLDSDTRMPRDTVRRLVGKMAHVLNRPRLDAARHRVVEGYGILQPRVTLALPYGTEGSWFQRVFSGAKGMDPYAAPVSDVYQDLFGEGTFYGKGIYDVDAFEASMEGRSPENAILSHDLLEGIFARAGLAGDIEVVEGFPRRYDVAASRQHRWARGDWQLLPWLLEWPQAGPGKPTPAPLLGRWKMLDNLRRTLSAPVTVVALLAGWTLSPGACLIWSAFVLAALAAPAILPVLLAALHISPRATWRGHFSTFLSDLYVAAAQSGFVVATLVHQAQLMTDAIVRTFWRLATTRKRLLEWTTAEQAANTTEMTLAGFYRWMWLSVAVAFVGAGIAFANSFATGLIALPFILAWLAAPVLVWQASRELPNRALAALAEADAQKLRLTARRTWRYFETFVTAEDNWLPPDNFQEAPPQPAIAHRTSPTNIGLYLLSIMAARDFGWIGRADAADRLHATFATMRRMFRFRGHLYNWYDTQNLRPLDPQYVSSVDSGNLAGHLITLANACEEAATEATARTHDGIADCIALTRAGLAESGAPSPAVAAVLDALAAGLKKAPQGIDGLRALEPLANAVVGATHERASAHDSKEDAVLVWAEATLATIRSHLRDEPAVSPEMAEQFAEIARRAREMANQMDFRFLMDPERQLLSIGYVTSENRRDGSYYDLLASEARLASFFAIAKGEAPTKHWFKLGRTTTAVEGAAALVSWSGSMFEYLMPSLVMRAPAGSLLDTTNRLIVRKQIAYGTALGVPWGISESAYNARDLEFTYQYSNFGVPGLGLKRGLSFHTVIAPYATALAAMIDPVAAARNYEALAALGGRGRFGFYEALDFTPTRVPEGKDVAVVHAYMAHHQGMSIVAIANVLLRGIARKRFHAEPIVAATELLLEERHPRLATAAPVRADKVAPADVRPAVHAPPREFNTAHTARPQSGLLSNTRYSVMVTNAGSGYSRWNNLAVTRWREDATLDDWGSYIYLRDRSDRRVWSAGYQPTCVEPESYSTVFAEDRVRITRRDRTIMTNLEIAVSAEDDVEVRRVSLTNMGGMERRIEVTSYAEAVLNTAADDLAHPAFSKMFVETEFLKEPGAILARRRKRDPDDPGIWAAHFAVMDGPSIGEVEVESDRARFIGIGRDLSAPQALDGQPLSNTVGIVLDPIFSVRRHLLVRPGTTTRVSFWTIVGASRDAVLDLIVKYDDAAAFDRVATLAWTHSQVQLRHIDLSSAEASLFQRLATSILFPEPRFRAPEEVLRSKAFEIRGLWSQGISGDLPMVVVRVDTVEDLQLARELVLAHEYLRLKRLSFDLVILNERGTSYAQDLQQALESLARMSETRLLHLADEGKVGRVFVLRDDLISPESRLAILLAARVVMAGSRGTLSEQLQRFASGSQAVPAPRGAKRPAASPAPRPHTLEFDNGLGGFGDRGREYVTTLEEGRRPPAPWINVVANPSFGFHIATDGASYTWSVNSRDNQITPWSNDPVVNRSGEALYIRDDDTGELWGPTAHPYQNPAGTYRARHGFGYSRFEHTAAEIAAELTAFVPIDDPVKILRLRLNNLSDRPRRLSVAAYVEWVLATSRSQSAATIVTEMSASGALLARNARNQSYPGRVAFLALRDGEASWTGVRREFLGRHGSSAEPAALVSGGSLSNRVGAGVDPCGALLTPVSLQPGETKEVVILLGEAASSEAADALAVKYRTADLDEARAAVSRQWDDILGAVAVVTPDRSMDVMLNGWLLYQALACRMWARSGFYQASGAFGFRDQLQDCLALTAAAPEIAREQILRAAARQFVEGDVQHWWLPTTGQGVRTRIADDTVWLAYGVAEYARATGDYGILDETLPYLEGPHLSDSEHDAFFQPGKSDRQASLYQHCVDALTHSLPTGEHGLPLIGAGDWNDGMNRIGIGGKGESVWLAWFLHKTLTDFAVIADGRNETAHATTWRKHAAALAAAVERNGWDGAWYRRAFFDDGTPVGSAENGECRIDSIAQSWAVISRASSQQRATTAMAEVEKQLLKPDEKLALLFTPPFNNSALEPGYIKGYPPGLRENGGQYTHAAIWLVIAQAMQGQGDKAAALFAMLNPINHAATKEEIARYKVEPYVVAADVYAADGHVGRGGWTWYTGSAGWLYRAGIEWILGLRREGGTLRIEPTIPASWSGFRASVRYGGSRYDISVSNPDATAGPVRQILLDGRSVPVSPPVIVLTDDGAKHHVTVVLGRT